MIFDDIAWYDGDCVNGSEPDIAGIGVRNLSECLTGTKADTPTGRALFRVSQCHDYRSIYSRDDP